MAGDVEIEGRIGAERRHHRKPRLDHQPDDLPEQRIDAFPDRQVLRPAAEMGGQRLLQGEILRVVVLPGRGGRFRDRLQDRRRRTEAVFVRADAGLYLKAAIALDRFGTDERHSRWQRIDEGRETGECRHDDGPAAEKPAHHRAE